MYQLFERFLNHYNDLIVEKVILDNQTASTSSAGNTAFTTDATKSKYTPLGVIGYSIDNATSNGTGSSLCGTYMVFLIGTTLTLTVHNFGNSSAKIKITWYVLYRFNH